MFLDESKKNDNENDKMIVSLGNYCITSMILKENNLKNTSYPFDWMISIIDNIIHVINDNFNEFLNRKNYLEVDNVLSTKNVFYFENTSTMFKEIKNDHPHHNLLSNQNHYNYLKRCVDRFHDLNKYNKIIFVMIQPLYLSPMVDLNKKLIIELYEILKNKFGDKIKLLIFTINKIDNSIYIENKINENIIIYELKTKLIDKYGMKYFDEEGIKQFIQIIQKS